MFSHKVFLKLGNFTGTDFMSLVKSGYELANFEFSFQQGIDEKGKASTEVFGGSLLLVLPSLPSNEIIAWALDSRKYQNGVIVILDEENAPQEKVLFENAACVNMGIEYIRKGESYIATSLVLQVEKMIVGNTDFDNNWVK